MGSKKKMSNKEKNLVDCLNLYMYYFLIMFQNFKNKSSTCWYITDKGERYYTDDGRWYK